VVQDNNIVVDSGVGVQVGGAACGGGPYVTHHDYVIEKNYFTKEDPSDGTGPAFAVQTISPAGSSRLDVRNNTIIHTNPATGGPSSFTISAQSGTNVYNNTCYRSDAGTSSHYCVAGTPGTCRNNVSYAPSWTGTHVWQSGSCGTASHNFDNGTTDNLGTSSPFRFETAGARWGFWPADGSPIQNGGFDVPSVFDDAIHACRKTPFGGMDAGALEFPVGVGDGAVSGVPGCR
jgi:hypothetical protein